MKDNIRLPNPKATMLVNRLRPLLQELSFTAILLAVLPLHLKNQIDPAH